MLNLRVPPVVAAFTCVLALHICVAAEAEEPLTLAWGGVHTVGPADQRADTVAAGLMESLADIPSIDLLTSEEVQTALADERSALLAGDRATARQLGERFSVHALVLLTAVTSPDILDDDPPQIRAIVIHSTAASPGVFPTSPVALDTDGPENALAAEVLSLLPVLGEVVGVIQTGGETSVQLHAHAGPDGLQDVGTQVHIHRRAASGQARLYVHSEGPDSVPLALPRERLCEAQVARVVDGERPEAVVVDGEIPSLGALVMAAPAGDGAYPSIADPTIIVSRPGGAVCTIEGQTMGVTPLVFGGEALAGAKIELEAEGYETFSAAMPDELEGSGWWRGSLTRIPPFGALKITSVPEGASVSVDGEEKGATPLMLPKVATGRHSIRVRLADHRPFVTDVNVALRETTSVQAALQRSAQPVTITSDPTGAEILADGMPLGTTPIHDVSLDVGRHTLVVRHDGYEASQHTVAVVPDAPPEPIDLKLTPLPGSLNVISQPRGAAVHLDDEPIGSTPLEMPQIPAGEHSIRVQKGGFETWDATVTIEPGKTARQQVELRRLEGDLAVETVPEGAEVFVDGTSIGRTPLETPAAVGERDIVIRAPEHESWRRVVEVREGETSRISVALIPGEPEPRPSPSEERQARSEAPPFDGIAEVEMFTADGDESVNLRVDVDRGPSQGRGSCRLWLSRPFPEETRTVAAEDLITVVIPGMRFPGERRQFTVPFGPVKEIQVGQQSERDGTVRVEIHTVIRPEVQFDFETDRMLRIYLESRTGNSAQGTSRQIALTFDDFPFCNSEGLLDTLDELDVRASLFVVGEKAEQYPDLMRRAACSGHGLENHSYTHPQFMEISDSQVELELKRCNEVIQSTCGLCPVLARAPGGHSNGRHERIMNELNLENCGWTINVADYRKHSASTIANRILREVEPGAVVLLHDGVPETLQALRTVVPKLRERGYSFAPAGELMGR